jgi:hypothetical protein
VNNTFPFLCEHLPRTDAWLDQLPQLQAAMSGKAKLKESNAFPQGKRNQDLLQRLNHLYQANTYLASVSRQLAGSASSLPPAQCQISEEPHNRNKARKARRTNKREKEDALAVVTRRSNQRFKVMVKHNTLHTYVPTFVVLSSFILFLRFLCVVTRA